MSRRPVNYKRAQKRTPTYYLLTLGCPKNTVDSEGMAMLLRQDGYQATVDPRSADLLVVNTCGFLEAAKEESIAALQELAGRKRRRQRLVAAGCLAQRNGDEVLRRVPEVDALLGTRRWMEIVPLAEKLQASRHHQRYSLLGDPQQVMGGPVLRPPVPAGSAYLKISDGCNAPCAFCSIPTFKGKLRSRPFAALVDEAESLVLQGARELVVVAQDSTDYGRDRGEPDSLPQLLAAICRRVPDLCWLRLMYAYPGHVSDRLIEVMARESQIVDYLDMPLQHAHRTTLRRMRRPSNPDWVLRTVEKLRQAMPDLALRTTFIVGYPGETDAEFRSLLQFMEAIEFDRLGVFRFSAEPGTPAADLPDQIPEEIKEARWHQVMALQQRISLARNQRQIGRELDVLVEGIGEAAYLSASAGAMASDSADGIPVGWGNGQRLNLARSYRDAPEVDGLVLIPGPALPVGEIGQVRITGALAYDLIGELAPGTGAPIEMDAGLEFEPAAELNLI